MSNGSGTPGPSPVPGRHDVYYSVAAPYLGQKQNSSPGSRIAGISDHSGYPENLPGFRPGLRTSAKFLPSLYRHPNAPDWQTTKCKVLHIFLML